MTVINNVPRELKPCPFCGCEVGLCTDSEYHMVRGDHALTCPFLDDEPIASADEWNTRALLATAQPAADGEREAFESWVRREWPQAPLSFVRDALPKNDPRYGEYCDDFLQRAWVGWQARAALPVQELK